MPARNGLGRARAAAEGGRVSVAMELSDTGGLRFDGVTTELIP